MEKRAVVRRVGARMVGWVWGAAGWVREGRGDEPR